MELKYKERSIEEIKSWTSEDLNTFPEDWKRIQELVNELLGSKDVLTEQDLLFIKLANDFGEFKYIINRYEEMVIKTAGYFNGKKETHGWDADFAIFSKLLFDIQVGYSNWDNKFHTLLIMNDIFIPASADSEEIKQDEWILVANIYDKFDYDGLIVWAANKRNQEPADYIKDTESYKMLKPIVLEYIKNFRQLD